MFKVSFEIKDSKPEGCAYRGKVNVAGISKQMYLIITVRIMGFPICNYWILK